MVLLVILLVPVVLAVPIVSTVNKFILKVDDAIVKSIRTIDEPSHDLNLSGLDIHGIDANVFENVSLVKNLSLANNRISTLPRAAFASMKDLEHLSLANNNIQSFHHSTFFGLDNLASLNISNNPIRRLSEASFYGLGKFTDVITLGIALNEMSTRVFEKQTSHEIIRRRKRSLQFECGNKDDFEIKREHYVTRIVDDNPKVKICIRAGVLEKLDAFTNTSELDAHCKKISTDYSGKAIAVQHLGISEFSAGWYHLQNYPIRSLSLNGNNIVNLSSQMFNDLPKGLFHIDLSSNKIERLVKGAIMNEHLLTLNFEGNAISEIDEGTFKNTQLEGLFLSGNRLRNTIFAASLPPTLTALRLNQNRIDELTPDSFSGLNKLEKITLAKNIITEIKVDALRGLGSLKVLDLSENTIKTIEKKSFQDLKSLKTLNLERNNLSSIVKGTFDGLENLAVLDLRWNDLTKITSDSLLGLSNLADLHLSFNHIETLHAGTFVNLPTSTLSLDNNNVKNIENGTFDIGILYKLDLKSNLLNQLNSDFLSGIRHLGILDLANNGITKIEKANAKYLHRLGMLDISKNPIKRLENGALYGLATFDRTIKLMDVPIELIQSGVFDDL